MATHIYRITVRGHFHGLDDTTRAALASEAAEHSIFRSAYTAEGTFTYDDRLVAFNFRYEVRRTEDAPDEARALALAEGEERARADLARWGIDHRHLRVTAADMAEMWTDPT